jgi:asparagine synthase (glutamine-hydrolysing)
MTPRPVERVVDLIDTAANRVAPLSVEEARARVASGDPRNVRAIPGSFALVAKEGETVRLARSLDRPLRYFLAKTTDGPMLVVSDRIDAIASFLSAEGLGDQFQPAYTRMVPAHHVVEIRLVGCPDPDPVYRRFFAPERGTLPPDLDVIGEAYVSAAAAEVERWLAELPPKEPIGVLFSGGADSGLVFLLTERLLRARGESPARLKAFTLDAGAGPDAAQARDFLDRLGLAFHLETFEVAPEEIEPLEAVRAIEDYKRRDVEAAAALLALCRAIRARYPDWRHLEDGDGGDENLKDYPIEENPELTIRSVLGNPMLYQEGWGVGTIKHSLTYSGGQSRGAARAWAPLRRHGFEGFSPLMAPPVVAVAEAIPFVALTRWSHERLYALKNEVVSRGVARVLGREMPTYPKRRFQDGALGDATPAPWASEREYRRAFTSLWA